MLRDNLRDTVQTIDGNDVLFYEFESYTAAFKRDRYDDRDDAPGSAFELEITQNTISTSGSELDFSARGMDWQGNTEIQRGPIQSWYSMEDDYIQSIDRIEKKDKYIKGIKAKLQRPFVVGDLLKSNIEILNQTK